MADLTITASSVLPGSSASIINDYTAGAELTAGTFVYLDSSNIWQKVDADSATGTESTRRFGVCLNHAYTGQRVSVDIKDDDLTVGATLVTGTTYVGSTTAGALAPSSDLASGDYPVVAFIAKSTSKGNLNPAAAGAAI